ncbi:MAG: hypothetical protein QNJ72_26240 [Pleurocapsa sp. MO_226.B13]|nr:hypothetical protein [Pleurocapsa sp. MO_226.B13]
MARRFSRLKYALRAIQDPNSDEARNEPPTGSILDKFQEFQSGSAGISYPRDEDSLPDSLDPVGVNPFGLLLNANNVVRIKISNRVLTETSLSAVRTEAGIETDPANAVLTLSGFTPAKATVFIEDATQPTAPETSQITGIRYKKRAGSSYTVPYGQKTGQTIEGQVRAAITTAVTSIPRASVSFKSERL